ncbi:MAG: hypothetical protein M1825_005497 [Sarcosagium campestre]|nr:MAG: hypothetical protein M1825_005497 [Sarcosagium campestre]
MSKALLTPKYRSSAEPTFTIAQIFGDSCIRIPRAAKGEDDWLSPICTASTALGLKGLSVSRKASRRWELKSQVRQQSYFSWSSFIHNGQQLEVDDTSTPPRKRQQQSTNENYKPPEASQTNISTPPVNNSQESSTLPPPVPAAEDRSPIETLQPSLSIGIYFKALVSALSSQNLSEVKARRFIDWLQNAMVQHGKDESFEPILPLVPAPLYSDLTFPFAVVEAKVCSTGRQIFKAENQAAVAMTCAQRILLCLDRLANTGKTTNIRPHVLFSITTQGPMHELWIHWTVVEDGVRLFKAKVWDNWNVQLPEQAEDCIIKLNNVCAWGTGPSMQSVVKTLGKVAVQAQAKT